MHLKEFIEEDFDLKEYIKKKHGSVQKFAKDVGISQTLASRFLNNKNVLSRESVVKISLRAGISLRAIYNHSFDYTVMQKEIAAVQFLHQGECQNEIAEIMLNGIKKNQSHSSS